MGKTNWRVEREQVADLVAMVQEQGQMESPLAVEMAHKRLVYNSQEAVAVDNIH